MNVKKKSRYNVTDLPTCRREFHADIYTLKAILSFGRGDIKGISVTPSLQLTAATRVFDRSHHSEKSTRLSQKASNSATSVDSEDHPMSQIRLMKFT